MLLRRARRGAAPRPASGTGIVQKEYRRPVSKAARQTSITIPVLCDYPASFRDFKTNDVALSRQTAAHRLIGVAGNSSSAFQINRQRRRSSDRLTKLLLPIKN
jgi:hypothetical protein